MSDTLPQSNTPALTTPTNVTPQPTSGSMAKEAGPHISFAETPLVQEIGQEMPLSSEVSKAGVTIQPGSVTLPPPIQKLGVKQVGVTVPVIAQDTTVKLPLTDDQIAQGLHQSIMSSWRWLAEWCTRQLKQAHFILQSIQGKVVRTED